MAETEDKEKRKTSNKGLWGSPMVGGQREGGQGVGIQRHVSMRLWL